MLKWNRQTILPNKPINFIHPFKFYYDANLELDNNKKKEEKILPKKMNVVRKWIHSINIL